VGSASAPNIVLITLDTTRADHLATYGYFRETTPAFDALARESIVFDRLVVPMATTLPTHMSILTGTYPLEHGVLANSTQGGERFVPSPKLHSFATLSQRAGYSTGAFVSAAPLKIGSGAETGFDLFDEPAGKHRNAEATTDAALEWLVGRSGPFFVWVHYYDAHYPFEPPPGFAGLYQTDAELESFIEERKISPSALRPLVNRVEQADAVANDYDAELRYADSQMARVLDSLRAREDWDRTVVIVIGDHGEGLCQHGLAAHGSTWNEQLHAPLLMRVPGQLPRRVPVMLSAVDALATLIGLVDLPQARDLLTQSSGRDVLAPDFEIRPVLSQDTGRHRTEGVPYRHALSLGRWKLFRIDSGSGEPSWELYDLEADPFELEDVSVEHPETTRKLSALLEREFSALAERGRALRGGEEPATRPEDPAILEQLKALGYVVDE